MPQHTRFHLNVGADSSVNAEDDLAVTISFQARPDKDYNLSENEQELIVCRLNEEIDWGIFEL